MTGERIKSRHVESACRIPPSIESRTLSIRWSKPLILDKSGLRKAGIGLSFVQVLAIVVIFMLNPHAISTRISMLALAAVGSMGPNIFFSAKDRTRDIGFILEGLYILSIAYLISVLFYDTLIY